jgi:hypothetical protein
MTIAPSANGPGRAAVAITPNNSTDLAVETRGLYVGAAGDVAVILADDSAAVTFTALAAGIVHPLAVKRVKVTGTTATGIVGVY